MSASSALFEAPHEPAAAAARLLAFYLPQYHPIPENDRFWGAGFTDWTNVVKTRPRFRGHQQPHLPADLGFYDLRSPEAREAQADLAREHGIHGFCYYHYWFSGRRLLHQPFDEVLASGRPDFPFCLCWANESWTRRWDGSEDGDAGVLVAQSYSHDDDRRHIEWLLPALRDPRAIRVRGRPLLLVYRASRLPDPRRTVETWRDAARKDGLGDLFLCNVESTPTEHGLAPRVGFDAGVEFAPDWLCLRRGLRKRKLWPLAARLGLSSRAFLDHRICEYEDVSAAMLRKPAPPYLRFPGVTPSWDNAARRTEGAVILRNATPAAYERWLRATLRRFRPPHDDERVVFVNAWNEWAEGNHLEPCERWGRGYVEATRRAWLEDGDGLRASASDPVSGAVARARARDSG